MRISVIDSINVSPATKLIKSDKLWLFSAKEWQRVMYNDIPHDTNGLRQRVSYKPKEIHYKSPHSFYIYFGMKMVDPKYKVGGFTYDGVVWWSRPGVRKVVTGEKLKLKNGSRLWDKKAISEKKNLILIRSMQNYIDRNL